MNKELQDKIGFWCILVLWLTSFAMPAITPNPNSWLYSPYEKNQSISGFVATFYLFIPFCAYIVVIATSGFRALGIHSVHDVALVIWSSCWATNIVMANAPFFWRRIKSKSGQVYVVVLALCTVVNIGPGIFPDRAIEAFHYGYWVWVISFALMTLLFFGGSLRTTHLQAK